MGIPYTLAFTTTAADGTRRWDEAIEEPIRTDGAERGGVVTVRDLGDRSLRPLQNEFNSLVEAHRGAYRSHPPKGKARRSSSGSRSADQRPQLVS